VKPLERWGLHLGWGLSVATGLAYGALRYFGKVQGEFGPAPHPWQGPAQHLHVMVVPVLVLALGMSIRGHAGGMLQHHVTRSRKSGVSMLGLLVPMIFAGYGLQVVTSDGARTALAWLHGGFAVSFVLAYAGHFFFSWRQTQPPPRETRA
jgi:hypothetical protein